MMYENAVLFDNFFDKEIIFTKELDDFLKENNIKYSYELSMVIPDGELIFSHGIKHIAFYPASKINDYPLTFIINKLESLLEE